MKGRRSWKGYAEILRLIVDWPGITAADLSRLCGLGDDHMRYVLKRMRALGLIHAPLMVPCRRGQETPGWLAGAGVNVACRRWAPCAPKTELIAFAAMLKALTVAPQTATTLAAASGVSVNRLRELLKSLQDLRLIFVCDWRRGRGNYAAVYRFGIDVDSMPRPAPCEKSAIDRAHRKRKQQRELHQQRMRALSCNASVFHFANAA